MSWVAPSDPAAVLTRLAEPGIEATEALVSPVLVQRLVDATLSGRRLGLGLVDRRLGELGNLISGSDAVERRRTSGGQFAAALRTFDLRRRAVGPSLVGWVCTCPGVVAEGLGDGADRLGQLTRDDPEGVPAFGQVRKRLQVLVGQHLGICVVAVDGLEDQVDGSGFTVGTKDGRLLVALRDQDLLLASPFGGENLGLPFPLRVQNGGP